MFYYSQYCLSAFESHLFDLINVNLIECDNV